MKQSSIDWLVQQLARKYGEFQALSFYYDHQDEIKRAKEMHKEEMKESYWESLMSRHQSFEKYYEETFNQNSK